MSAIRKILTVGVGAMLALQSVTAGAALNAYVKLTGQKQGEFKGNSTVEKTGDIVVKMSHGPTSPAQFNQRRAAGGAAAIHEPILLTLKLDNATRAQWVAAAAGKERITAAQILLFKTASDGKTALSETINLRNAAIEQIDFAPAPAADEALPASTDGANGAVYTRVKLDFEQITITWTKGGVTAGDDWTDPV